MNPQPDAIDDKRWKGLRYRGAPLKQHVLGDLPESAAPFGETVWQSFKQQCAAEGNVLPRLISQLEPQVPAPGMFRRRGPRKVRGSDPFEDLPLAERLKAEAEFGRLCERWAGDLPPWRRAILVGRAGWLALHPPDSEWGRRMRRIKGGVHCQRKYREQGSHPLARFNQAMAKRHSSGRGHQAMAKRQKQAPAVILPESDRRATETCKTPVQEARNRLDITPEQMRRVPRITPLLESVEGGIAEVIEALRWSDAPAAVAFLDKYDSVPRADLKHLSIEEICVAAGVDTRQLFRLAVDRLSYLFLSRVQLQLCCGSTRVLKATIKNALKDKGFRDRKLVLQMAGILPVPKSWTCPLWLKNAGTRRTEARPGEALPAKSQWELSRTPALPGKTS